MSDKELQKVIRKDDLTVIQEEIKKKPSIEKQFEVIKSNKVNELDSLKTKLEDKNSCKLQRLYILNDFIALKIGSQLQDLILEKAKELNFTSIWLTAYYKNIKGLRFYDRYGFKQIGSIDFFVGETNYENLVFAKKL